MVSNKLGLHHLNFIHEYNQFVAEINEALRAYFATTIRTDQQTVNEINVHHESIIIHLRAMIAKAKRIGLLDPTPQQEARRADPRPAAFALRISEN